MQLIYRQETKELSCPNRIAIDYDATLDPLSTIMFYQIKHDQFRTIIIQNNGCVIKTPKTPKALIKELFGSYVNLGSLIIDGIIYHQYQALHPGTRQLPIMGRECLIMPVNGTTRKQGCWIFLNNYSVRKEAPNLFAIDIPENQYEIHIETNEKAFQRNKHIAYRCYSMAQSILPQHFMVKIPPKYQIDPSGIDLLQFFQGIGFSKVAQVLKQHFDMSTREIERIIK